MSIMQNSSTNEVQHSDMMSEQEKMLSSMTCVVESRSATYISGPITTGLNFLEWYSSAGRFLDRASDDYKNQMRRQVIQANEIEIISLAHRERQLRNRPVIEPASLAIREWDQRDYIRFWLAVLDRFVCDVILVRGWQYSAGCAAEFSYALNHGCSVFTHDGQPMTRHIGNQLIFKAADEVEAQSHKDPLLLQLAVNLRTSCL